MTLLQKLKNQLYRLPNKLAILGIHLYRLLLSPSVGLLRYIPFYPRPSCIFYPTCSEYSIECFKKYSFFRAVYTTTKRIGRCHPGNDPQIDLP